MGGGGLVPLSRAICCRPCLPGELPKPYHGNSTARPVAVVSLGCHASTGKQFRALSCEQSGSSFVTGFSQAERVASVAYDEYYPVGQVECCTPAVLLSSGEVWQLKRCDCATSSSKDCGGTNTDRLLWGFSQWRVTSGGEYIPVAPLECCGLCLGDKIHDRTNCEDLNFCSNNGICTLGACECFEGYGGSDCSVRTGGGDEGAGVPWWGTLLIVAGSIAFISGSSIAMRLAFATIRAHAAGGGGGGGAGQGLDAADPNGLSRPLLLALDDEGSAGSHDTDEQDLTGFCEDSDSCGGGGGGGGGGGSGTGGHPHYGQGSGAPRSHSAAARVQRRRHEAGGAGRRGEGGPGRGGGAGAVGVGSPVPSSLSNSEAIIFQMDDVAQLTPPNGGPEPISEQPEAEHAAQLAEAQVAVQRPHLAPIVLPSMADDPTPSAALAHTGQTTPRYGHGPQDAAAASGGASQRNSQDASPLLSSGLPPAAVATASLPSPQRTAGAGAVEESAFGVAATAGEAAGLLLRAGSGSLVHAAAAAEAAPVPIGPSLGVGGGAAAQPALCLPMVLSLPMVRSTSLSRSQYSLHNGWLDQQLHAERQPPEGEPQQAWSDAGSGASGQLG
ncbi:hypothetical protein GPECTOR_21g645 [Gonium pectorale]|uniref:EGF-like domain-containing protein n=1 Tax=Gonium pectorale TaxID=33097 RepID=A0A150GHZ1_GONPE|nr:hypothetical protein GPECTOR_21g645 [Gonium pectorale]|eukprot:KXZ49419.1 hypothetical protein GPECTOR_21g645 [Gonium pectorale]